MWNFVSKNMYYRSIVHVCKWRYNCVFPTISRKACKHLRHSSSSTNKESPKNRNSFFISTPIFYVNSVPHIGHLHSTVLADTLSRWKRLKQYDIIFSTGTDEHGQKIQQSAEKNNTSPQEHCDVISQQFNHLFKAADILNTDFIRTTEDRHIRVVNHFWEVLYSRGYIERGSYDGWYSTSDEAFVPEDLVSTVPGPDGNPIKVATDSGQPVSWISEENYMFPLPKLRDDLLYWLKGSVIHPVHFEPQVVKFVEENLQDLSVSRPRERLHWGIPVPGDPTQTIYVWLDALVNYLTVGGYPDHGYTWPADCHIVGKDILKFHAVYWPAFLIAAGLEPPRNILCHSHWLVNGKKMSKSLGNVVNPVTALSDLSSDGLRYFLMREAVHHTDGNFLFERAVHLLNSELANTFGNLLGRCTSKALNKSQIFPKFNETEFKCLARAEDVDMWNQLSELRDTVDMHYENYEIHKAIEAVMSQLRSTNNFMEYHRPWDLVKIMDDKPWLDTLLHVTMETLRVSAILLCPVIPKMTQTIVDKLNVPLSIQTLEACSVHYDAGIDLEVTSTKPVFPRIKL